MGSEPAGEAPPVTVTALTDLRSGHVSLFNNNDHNKTNVTTPKTTAAETTSTKTTASTDDQDEVQDQT